MILLLFLFIRSCLLGRPRRHWSFIAVGSSHSFVGQSIPFIPPTRFYRFTSEIVADEFVGSSATFHSLLRLSTVQQITANRHFHTPRLIPNGRCFIYLTTKKRAACVSSVVFLTTASSWGNLPAISAKIQVLRTVEECSRPKGSSLEMEWKIETEMLTRRWCQPWGVTHRSRSTSRMSSSDIHYDKKALAHTSTQDV